MVTLRNTGGSTIDQIEPVPRMSDLSKRIWVPREAFDLWMQFWDWTSHQLSRNEFPEPFSDIVEFQLACLSADPGLWIPAFLREPEDPDHQDPYSLLDHQLESARYPGHTLHKCGAEVGKTREIVAKGLFKTYTIRNASGLIAGPQQTHLEEIIEAMDDQLTWNLDLGKQRWHRRHRDGWKKHPHHAFYFKHGAKIDFRPSGYDGEAFRGVHVRTYGLIDEAVKMKNPKQWSEFWRALKPGCVAGVYTVPDGDRSCDFYKLGQRAVKTEPAATDTERLLITLFDIYRKRLAGEREIRIPAIEEIYNATIKDKTVEDSGPETVASFKDAPSYVQTIKFKLFHWPKTIMPFPYWSEERRLFYRDQYNGEDSPGYKHNVLGEDGDPESTVFPHEQFRHVIKEIPEYRCLKILVDAGRNEVIISGYKCEFVPGDTGPVPRAISLLDEVRPMTSFFEREVLKAIIDPRDPTVTLKICGDSDFTRLIKNFFVFVPGLKRGGGDFGFAGDPTETIVKSIYGEKKRLIARLNLKHVTYDQQCQALNALDDLYGPKESISWGTDLGNAGSAVAHDLMGLPEYAHKNYSDRLKGFQFESTTENFDETGETIKDAKDDKPMKITLKELATDHMTRRIQRMTVEYPPDPDIPFFYTNHTVSMGKHRIYKKEDDHLIDADRAETLAEILGANVAPEQFAAGSYKR